MTITNTILTDIDECAQDTHNCSKENALCHNSVGSFNCTCKPGLTGDGHNCTGIEIIMVVIFRRKPIFLKRVGGNDTWYMMTITNNILTDIDECAQDTHNCSKENALCHNSEGSFSCTCKPGLTGDGHSCTGTEIMLVVIFRRKPIFF